jgi:multidrug efflux pump
MTTAAMVLGVIPLITATGAGAVSRFNMGLVIASGLAVGTLFTLFVVPAVYLLIATNHSRTGKVGACAGIIIPMYGIEQLGADFCKTN